MSSSSSSGAISANGTTIQAGSTLAITDAAGNLWTIVNGMVEENGAAAGYSANVIELAYVNNTIWQENNAGGWWSWSNGGWAAGSNPLPAASPPPASGSGSGHFSVSNGQIYDPNGQKFVARGINIMGYNGPSAATLKADFPGINYVRMAIYDYASPTTLASYVNSLTQAGIVVELEDHTNSNGGNAGGSQGQIFTGQQLQTELNWYSSVASAFKSNPMVWFGTNNEPSEIDASGNTNPAALSTWQQQTYNAIRNTGNTSPVLMEMNGWSVQSTGQGYTPAVYAAMTNIIWDLHYYGWLSNYSTDQTTVTNTLLGMAAQAQTLTSADGKVPMLIGEYGNSTTGTSIDANADQVIAAVRASGFSSAAWAWGQGNPGDGLTNSDGSLSSYGQQVATLIAAAAAANPGPSGGGSTPPSANDTVVLAGSGGAITDANGHSWTITSGGQVAVDGVTDTTTANVIELAYVNGTVWHENASKMWWGKTSPTASWSPSAGTSQSPLPAVSANDTVVRAGSTAAIIDASYNSWTITSGGQVAVNGVADTTTANVIELAYVNGTVWQENASKMWWGKTSPTAAWSPSAGTATSPLPPAASANDTVVLAGSTAAITDASGNQWTITSGGQVAVNGTADATTGRVIELAYVNGTVWQENADKMWWGKTSPTASWSPGTGTSQSPLPAISVTASGTTSSVDATKTGTTTVAGDSFVLTSPGNAKVTLGATASTLKFTNMNGIVLTGGSASAVVSSNAGTNTFTSGKGALEVAGGTGADAYVYHSGSGRLTIDDLSFAKGDTLTIDKGLKASMSSGSDGHGGTLLTFGSAGSIDIKNVAAIPAANLHWQ